MGTATQLVPAFVDAEPLEFSGREYSKNMRPIRGYPDYWRIIDNEAYVDGPSFLGGPYEKELFIWRASILKDEDLNNTDTVEIENLGDYLTVTSSEIGGETVYRYKYDSQTENYSYQHSDIIDSVSLEFDQSGRRIVAFESASDINLIWFDPVLGDETVTNFGAGYTPYIVTDTYRRRGGSADSERLLFYVKNSTKQIVYRRQLDRYGVEYTLPNAPSDVVEIIQVSKNIYGGLTVLYCYESGGELVTGSFTARDAVDTVNFSTDEGLVDSAQLLVKSAEILEFALKKVGVPVTAQDSAFIAGVGTTSATLLNFLLGEKIVTTSSETDTATLQGSGSSVQNFALKEAIVDVLSEADSATVSGSTGTVQNFKLAVTLIEAMSETDSATLSGNSATVQNFLLGV